MSEIPFRLRPDETIVMATERFLRHQVDVAPVVDENGYLIGVLSENDVMAAMFWPNRRTIRVQEAMKSDIAAYDEQTPIIDIYESLCRSWIRNAIIVKDRRPPGVIGQDTLLQCFNRSMESDPLAV
jgi:predicted transcriptional regulator